MTQTPFKNGCHNHKPYAKTLWVQDGWAIDQSVVVKDKSTRRMIPVFKEIPNRMNYDCQYTLSRKNNEDPGCDGCKWKSPNPPFNY